MGKFIELISEIAPINNGNFAIADVNNFRGGYIQVDTMQEMEDFKTTNKVKEGMLCYVKNSSSDTNMFQLKSNMWLPFTVDGSGGDVSVRVVQTLEDLYSLPNPFIGQLVFVTNEDYLYFFNGTVWETFNRIYIQDTPPQDEKGVWIDTSKHTFKSSDDVILTLTKTITILETRLKTMEYAFQNQLDFGGFTNNSLTKFKDTPGIEPGYGSNPDEDTKLLKYFLENGIDPNAEPIDLKSIVPNGVHLQIKGGTYKDMLAHLSEFLPKELLWCEDRQELWIKDSKTFKLVKIGSSSNPDPEPEPDPTMEGILTELIGGKNKIIGIEFADMCGKENIYTVQIENGELKVKDNRLNQKTVLESKQEEINKYCATLYFPVGDAGNATTPRVYINSIYSGMNNTKSDYCPVSHNFIELCNLSDIDINLKGLFLHYTEGNTGRWITLPLIGTLKSRGTFLIRGAQCSVLNINTTYIKVPEPDMYWDKASTLHPDILNTTGDGVNPDRNIWDSDNLIKLNYDCAFYLTGSLTLNDFNDAPFENKVLHKINASTKKPEVLKYYINLLGIGKMDESTNMPAEYSPFTTKGKDYLILRYLNMDPVKLANKNILDRKNTTDYTYLNLPVVKDTIDVNMYTPQPSKANKNLFFNKNILVEGKPNILNCTFGYNAHTTRCFNWMSVGYYDEFLQYRKQGTAEWLTIESFKEGDNRPALNNRNHAIYNRIRSITTDGTAYTVHKCIIDLPEPDSTDLKHVYEYRSGREGFWTDIRTFTLRNRQDCIDNGFNFLHVTDQQGFVEEEYETWRLCAEVIDKEKTLPNKNYDFVINTGDATQNGNRINEWLDYFNQGRVIFDSKEQIYTVGNNDLCSPDPILLGNGDDVDKTNPVNTQYFFTNEHPFEVPMSNAGVYIPCVYSFFYGNTYIMSTITEIPANAKTLVYKDLDGVDVFDAIKRWSIADNAEIMKDTKIQFKGCICHESPFTIITRSLVNDFVKPNTEGILVEDLSVTRKGSRANTEGGYWLSQFLQSNGFKFCLCGHKHTYCESRWLHDSMDITMKPYIYDPLGEEANWYKNDTSAVGKHLGRVTSDATKGYVKYIMCQATGYKLTSNKELPADNIPWLVNYYPSAVVNGADSAAAGLKYPHYIIFNVGTGTEVENPAESTTSRNRIKGNAYKIKHKTKNTWAYKYNAPIVSSELETIDGNGADNPNYNIIIS